MSEKTIHDIESSPRSDRYDRKTDYFNYHPPFLLVALEFTIWIALCLVCFAAPNGGLSTVVKDEGGNHVGVLRQCSKTKCEGWMAASSSSSPAPASADTQTNPETRRSLHSRDISSLDLPSFYLRAGLGTLACFWLMTYTLIFLVIRYTSSPPPLSRADTKGTRGIRDMIKRFSWRISRIFTFFLTFIVLGVACDATWQIKEAGLGGSGIGLGALLLHLSWILLILCTYLETSRGYVRQKADLTYWGCGFLQFCPTYKQRAIDKWELRGNSGDAEADVDHGDSPGSRTSSRSRNRDRSRGRTRTRESSKSRKSRKEDSRFEDVAI